MRDLDQETKQLAERFAGRNRAAFARETKFPGGQAMIYQNITGRKPISLDGAIAYAKGFGCPIAEISRHWAQIIAHLPIYATEPESRYGANITPMEAHRPALTRLQAELVEITSTMSEVGVAMLIGRAQELAIQHPSRPVKNRQN